MFSFSTQPPKKFSGRIAQTIVRNFSCDGKRFSYPTRIRLSAPLQENGEGIFSYVADSSNRSLIPLMPRRTDTALGVLQPLTQRAPVVCWLLLLLAFVAVCV